MTRLWWVLALLVALIVASMVATSGVIATASGSRWVVERAVAASGAPIELSGLDGTLLRSMRADTLRIRAGDTIVEMRSLEIDAAWVASMLRRALVIDRLAAASLQVISHGEKKPAPLSVVLPHLPFALDVRSLSIGATAISNVPTEYAPAVSGRLSYVGTSYALKGVELHAAAYSIDGDLALTATRDVSVSGALNWRLTEPALSGSAELRDSLRALGVTLHVDAPSIEAHGTVRLLGEVRPRFDVEGRMAEWNSERVRVAGLNAHFAGTLEQFDVHATTAINAPDLPQAAGFARRDGIVRCARVSRLALSTDQGGVVAHGRVARTPEWSVDLTADVDNLDPALFAATLSGCVVGSCAGECGRQRSRSHDPIAGRARERCAVRSERTRRPARRQVVGERRGDTVRSEPRDARHWNGKAIG